MKKTSPQIAWYRQAAILITQHMLLKCLGTILFISLFFAGYFYVLNNPVYPVTVMPITLLDELISFQPTMLPLYLSLWFYVSLPPALLATRHALFDYTVAIALTCFIGLIIFYFWPTTLPMATLEWAQSSEINFFKGIDAAGNACPSLHVATVFFSGSWLHYLLRRLNAPLSICIVNWLWCMGIIYSTLAIRQHVFVDVIAGLILGGLMAYLSLRHHKNKPDHHVKP